MKLKTELIKDLIKKSLREDIGTGDITTLATIPQKQIGQGVFLCKEAGILAGTDVIKFIVNQFSSTLSVKFFKKDGEKICFKEEFGIISGSLSEILTLERTLLNFLQRMSGVATFTSKFVEKIKGTNAKILDTRKTIPGWRYLDKLAVKIGGGSNHRFGLYDMFLIKDNHIAIVGGITEAVKRCRDYMKRRNRRFKIEVETKNLDEVKEALDNKVDIIMLDNFSLENILSAVKLISKKCKIEVSGNVNLDTVEAIAKTGVDFISVGAITHSAKALDISLEIK
ncbi:MAG: carboxylating nicotinate-nucleotide diphosphorylase [Ignavibacteria bacterium]|nr:carboxylating nicotinate-nucleotide diphosphorylase [Ignavibacteria bacterium]